MQLVACGAEDLFLTGNPLISYFKLVYRRHTNFAMENIRQKFDEQVDFKKKVSSLLTRNGDLISNAYIQATLPDLIEKNTSNFTIGLNGLTAPNRRYMRWVDNVGHQLIKSVSVDIGGKTIDKHYSDWLEIWTQLTVPASKIDGYRQMIGQDKKNFLNQNTGLQADVLSALAGPNNTYIENKIVGRDIFIPLKFWFCRNVGLSLPLISLQYHPVRINVEFRSAEELILVYSGDVTDEDGRVAGWVALNNFNKYVNYSSLQATLWIEYVFLDVEERRRFAQVSHEYLIEQVQLIESPCMPDSIKTINLSFNHPVKELIWVIKGFEDSKEYSNFTDTQLPLVPPFETTSITQNNIPIAGLTGLPDETYLDPTKLQLTIQNTTGAQIPALSLIGQFGIFTNIPTYKMKIGDIITLKAAASTDNLVVTVAGITAESVADDYIIQQALPVNIIYNRVISIVRVAVQPIFAINAQPYGLDNITTFNDLMKFSNYDSNRPYSSINGFAGNPILKAYITINGANRFEERPGSYFNLVQPYNSHTCIPESPGINLYSFSLKPEEHQPSGTCNFSRIDSAKLVLHIGSMYSTTAKISKELKLCIYAVNYNILRIVNGMGGLAYNS